MKPKPIASIFLITALCAGGAYYFFKFRTPPQKLDVILPQTTTSTGVPPSGLIDESLIEPKRIQKEDAYSTIDVKYPHIRNIPTIENDSIRTTFERAIKDHTALSAENAKARIGTATPGAPIPKEDKYPFYSEYKIVQANSDFVSILFTYGGDQGGAHGYENIFSFNYDVKNKKRIYLKDVFKKEADPIGFVAGESRKRLLEKLLPKVIYKPTFGALFLKTEEDASMAEMIYAGTEPETSNFKVYTFTPTDLTFYFGEYQVAAYAYGRQEITFPYVPAFYTLAEPPAENTVQ